MATKRTILINYFSEALGMEKADLINLLNNPKQEFYNLEYYLQIAYGWHRISYKIIRELYLENIKDKDKVLTILDIGCGTGLYLRMILEKSKEYIGLDLSQDAINIARQLHSENSHARFILGEANQINISDNSVDLIFCSEVIEHITDLEKIFDSFKKVLKKDGKVFLTTTTYYYYIAHILVHFGYRDIYKGGDFRRFVHRLWLYIKGFMGPQERSNFMLEGLERSDHVHAFTFKQLSYLCNQSGFVISWYKYFNCKDIFSHRVFFPLNWILKKLFRTSNLYGPNIALILKLKT